MDAKAKELIKQEKEKRRLERELKKKEQLKHESIEKTEKRNSPGNGEQCFSPHLQLNVIKHTKVPTEVEEKTQYLNYGEGSFIKNKTQEPSAPTNKENPNRNLKNQFEIYTKNVQKGSEDKEHSKKNIKKQKCYSNDNNVINELSDTSCVISEKKRNEIRTAQNGDEYYALKTENIGKTLTYEVDQHKDKETVTGMDKDIVKNKGTIKEIYELMESDNEDINGLGFSKNEETSTPNYRRKDIFFRKTEEVIRDEESSYSKMEMEEELNKKFSRNMNDLKINRDAENVKKDLLKEGFPFTNFETVGIMDTAKFDEWFQDYIHNIGNNALDHSAYYEEVEYLLQLLKDKKKKLVGNLCDDDNKNEAQKLTEEDILDELEAFHKNINTDIDKNKEEWNGRDKETGKGKGRGKGNGKGKGRAPVYDIDRIYEQLGIQKREEEEVIGFSLIENEEKIVEGKENRKEKEKENTDQIAEKKDVPKLPKGFFDDKAKKEFLKAQSELTKIEEQIQFLENEKRMLLQEYENAGFVYDEKINSYIDYLYDDQYENREVIMQQIKEKTHKGNQAKGEHIRLIKEMLEDNKKKKEKKRREK